MIARLALAGRWVLAAVRRLLGLVAAIPARFIIIGLVVLLAIQTVRIDGLRIDLPLIGTIGPKGLVAANADLRVRLDLMQAQRDAAEAIARALAYANSQATERADADVERQLESERDRADSFIAAGGVRKCPSPRADTTTTGQSAGIDAGAGALPELDDVPVVTVLPEDVRICTENTVKARAWRDWGLAIEANHTPVP